MDMIIIYICIVALAVWLLISEIVIWKSLKTKQQDIMAIDEELVGFDRELKEISGRVRHVVGILKKKERR